MNVISRRLSPERRARIVDAARHLILRQGLRATTMEAIAREARIAKPTLYGYFPDKEAVFAAIIQALVDDIRAAVRRSSERRRRRRRADRRRAGCKIQGRRQAARGLAACRRALLRARPLGCCAVRSGRAADRGGDHRRAAAGRCRPAASAGPVAAGQRLRHRIEGGDAGRDRAGDPPAGRAAGKAGTPWSRVASRICTPGRWANPFAAKMRQRAA